MRDSLCGIIDDDGQHVGIHLIAPLENDVADGGGDVLTVPALDAIGKVDVAGSTRRRVAVGVPDTAGCMRQVPG